MGRSLTGRIFRIKEAVNLYFEEKRREEDREREEDFGMELMELLNTRLDAIEEKLGKTASNLVDLNSNIIDLNSDLSDLGFYGGLESKHKWYGIDK